jgi:predicted dehydrogenase
VGTPIRLGIIGLGRRWSQRYLPALRQLGQHCTVRAVCDPVPQRTAQEAQRIGCAGAGGPTELLERDDIDAVLLLDAPWYRLWPIELACRFGKPVFCSPSLSLDEAHADALCKQVKESRLAVMVELPPRVAPATACLARLFETSLGPARRMLCHFGQPLLAGGGRASGLGSAHLAAVDWCVGLMGTDPIRVLLTADEAAAFSNLLLDFPDGRAAQITCWRSSGKLPPGERTPRLRIIAERGSALVELPGRLEWTDAEGSHTHTVGRWQPARAQLERFFDALIQGHPPRSSLDDAHRALGWLRAAIASRAEGRPRFLTDNPPESGDAR